MDVHVGLASWPIDAYRQQIDRDQSSLPPCPPLLYYPVNDTAAAAAAAVASSVKVLLALNREAVAQLELRGEFSISS